MKQTKKTTSISKKVQKKSAWILFFYSVPSKPVRNRIKIWRRLVRAGAVQLKGAMYILPYNEEHYEFCQWLMAEVASLGGEGDFVITDTFEMLNNSDIVALFSRQREADYNNLEKRLNELEMKLNSVEKGSKVKNTKNLQVQFDRFWKEYSDIKEIDFFPSRSAAEVGKKISSLQKKMSKVLSTSRAEETDEMKTTIPRRHPDDYRGRVWTTRKNPFVDRMASAWLIRKFIDKDAVFRFISEHDGQDAYRNSVTFDMKNGEFTHVGDQCTYEVLLRAFGIKDRTSRKMAEIIHELDMKDDRFSSPEAKGIEEILAGIRKTAKNDTDALEKGITLFDMFYSSKT